MRKIEFSQEQKQQIKELFDQGMGKSKISQATGIPHWHLRKIYKELKLDPSGRKGGGCKPKTAYLATERKCKDCQIIKSINQFRQRNRRGSIQYEYSCQKCEKEKANKNRTAEKDKK